MIRIVSTLALLSIGATFAIAQVTGGAAIEERKKLMEAADKPLRVVAKMVKGEAEFNKSTVDEWLQASQNVTKAKLLFPEDSKQGGETRAVPEIWTKRAEFDSKFDALAETVKRVTGKANDVESLKAVFKDVDGACNACHKDFRARRQR